MLRRLSIVASVVALCTVGLYGAAYAADDDDGRAECGKSMQSSYASDESEDWRDDSTYESGDSDDSNDCYRVSYQSHGGRGGEPGVNTVSCGSKYTASGPVHKCEASPAQRGADG